MATPPSHNAQSPAPKTPGWGRALFGTMFSASKNAKPVEASSNRTEKLIPLQRPEVSFHRPSPAPSSVAPAISGSTEATNTGAMDSAQATPHRVQFSREVKQLSATRSPWKSPARRTIQRSAPKASDSKKVIPVSSMKLASKHRPYRPRSYLLMKTTRPTASIDPILAVDVLERLEGAFPPSRQQMDRRQSMASFKAGKRLLGSNQRASRLPPPPDTEHPNHVSFDGDSKRQKKVSFRDKNPAVVVAQVSTPARIELPRKETPFKISTTGDSEIVHASSSSSSPSSSAKKLERLPHWPGLLHEASDNHEAALEDIGDPIVGDIRMAWKWEACTQSGGRIPVLAPFDQAKYRSSQLDAVKAQNSNESKSSSVEEISPTNEGQARAKKSRSEADSQWACDKCYHMNPNDTTNCGSCGTGRKRNPESSSSGWGDLFLNLNKGKWKCKVCSVYNHDDKTVCMSCENPRENSSSCESKMTAIQTTVELEKSISSTCGSTHTTNSSEPKKFEFGTASSAKTPQNQSGSVAASTGKVQSGGFKFGAVSSSETRGRFGAHASVNTKSSSAETKITNDDTCAAQKSGPNGEKPFTFKLETSNPMQSTSDSGSNSFVSIIERNADTRTSKLLSPESKVLTDLVAKPLERGTNGGSVVTPSASNATDLNTFTFASSTMSKDGSKSKTTQPFTFASEPNENSKHSSLGTKFTFGADSKSKPENASQFSFGVSNSQGQHSVSTAESSCVNSNASAGTLSSTASEDRAKRRRGGEGKDNEVGSVSKKNPQSQSFSATADKISMKQPGTETPKFSFGTTAAAAATGGDEFGFSSRAANGNGALNMSLSGPSTADMSSTPAKSLENRSEPAALSNPFGNVTTPAAALGGFNFGSQTSATPSFSFGKSAGASASHNLGKGVGATNGSQSNLFGGGSGQSSAPAATSSAGGSFGNASAAVTSGPAPMFGSAATGQNVAAAQGGTSSSFGQAPAATNPFGSGQATTQGFSFGATPASTTAPTMFGSNPAPVSAQASQAGLTSTQPFGATTGAPVHTQPFGSAPVAPASSQPFTSQTFGSTSAAPAAPFGSTQPPSTTSQPFRSAPAAPAQGFFGSSSSQPMNSFGSSTPTQTQSFGFANSTPASTGTGIGSFGSAQQMPSSGFGGGFGSANPSTPGMDMNQTPQFSIGSGGGRVSTGSRRRIKARRPTTRPA